MIIDTSRFVKEFGGFILAGVFAAAIAFGVTRVLDVPPVAPVGKPPAASPQCKCSPKPCPPAEPCPPVGPFRVVCPYCRGVMSAVPTSTSEIGSLVGNGHKEAKAIGIAPPPAAPR